MGEPEPLFLGSVCQKPLEASLLLILDTTIGPPPPVSRQLLSRADFLSAYVKIEDNKTCDILGFCQNSVGGETKAEGQVTNPLASCTKHILMLLLIKVSFFFPECGGREETIYFLKVSLQEK